MTGEQYIHLDLREATMHINERDPKHLARLQNTGNTESTTNIGHTLVYMRRRCSFSARYL